MYKMYTKNPLCTAVDKTYRMYIKVMYNVQNVHTGRPVLVHPEYDRNNQPLDSTTFV